MQVKVIKDIRYAGRSYKPGDMCEMTDSHANTFTRMKKVMVPPPDPVPPKTTRSESTTGAKPYRRRDMVAEQPRPEPPPAPEPPDVPVMSPAPEPEEYIDLPPLPKSEDK